MSSDIAVKVIEKCTSSQNVPPLDNKTSLSRWFCTPLGLMLLFVYMNIYSLRVCATVPSTNRCRAALAFYRRLGLLMRMHSVMMDCVHLM